jgi:hypothetical protein
MRRTIAHTQVNAYRILAGQPIDRETLRLHSHRRKNNIKMDLKNLMCEDMNWIHLAQNGIQ